MTNTDDKSIQVDLSDEKVHWNLSDKLSYADYLDLGTLLRAQKPRTTQHDETLFIAVHQVSELWLKVILHELPVAVKKVGRGELRSAMKHLSRIVRVIHQLTGVWTVLSTMTPSDYADFRDELGASSGFQSSQYRTIEFLLGNKNKAMAKVHSHDPEAHARVTEALNAPSLYDALLIHMQSQGFAIPKSKASRDWSEPYEPCARVEGVWKNVYTKRSEYWDLYEFAEKLVDLEADFQQWRFQHMKTVSRIIGMKRGTGGTQGVGYLEKALQLRFFPELWSVRTKL